MEMDRRVILELVRGEGLENASRGRGDFERGNGERAEGA
jgi:hypothetical protein